MNTRPNADVTVLVVDDQEDVRRGTVLALERAGYRMFSAAGGEEALRLMAASRADIVLLDWDMPDLDGLEVCRRIKAEPAYADSVVIIASAAFTSSEQQKQGLSTGADGFIARPVTNVDLLARVQAFARVAMLTRESRARAEQAEQALADLKRRQLAELNLLEDAVAERKKAETALKLLEENNLIFSRFMENSPNYVFFKDEDIRSIRLSRNFEQLIGKPLEQQLGRRMDELFPAEFARKMVEDDKRALAGGKVVTVEEEFNGRQYSTIKFPIVVDGKPRFLAGYTTDVTERRRSEEQVRASERRFRETLDQLMEGAMILDFNWTCLYANRALAHHGRQPLENLIGRNWLEAYPGIENTAVFAGYQAVMKDRVAKRYEAPFVFADGYTAWFELNVTPVSQGIFVMSHEITDSRNVADRDAALLELEMQASALDEKALLQLGLDRLEKLTRSRIGFLHFVNEDQDEISLVTWTTDTMANYCQVAYDSHYPVSAAGVWADSIRTKSAVIVNDYSTAENRKGLPEGHAHLQRFVSVPVLENGLVRMIVGVGNSAIDYQAADATTISQFAYEMYRIVQRKRAEDALRGSESALRISEAKFRGIVEQSMVGVYMLDGDKLHYANPRAAEILGHAPTDLEGAPLLPLIADEDRPPVTKLIEAINQGKTDVGRFEYKVRRKDGAEVIVGTEVRRTELDGKPAIIGVLQDVTSRVRSEEKEREYTARLENAVLGTVGAVSYMMDLRDPYTAGHERRVGELSARIAAEMGLSENFQRGLRVAGGVHDVGKITVPAEILNKPGKLSAIEFEIIKSHAEQGYEVLKNVDFPWPVAEVARQHHERIDGSGYPRGLKGEEIILEARILAVADVVEAMSTHRPYRPALGVDAALAEIERGRGTAFDPVVAEACLRLFRETGYQLPGN